MREDIDTGRIGPLVAEDRIRELMNTTPDLALRHALKQLLDGIKAGRTVDQAIGLVAVGGACDRVGVESRR